MHGLSIRYINQLEKVDFIDGHKFYIYNGRPRIMISCDGLEDGKEIDIEEIKDYINYYKTSILTTLCEAFNAFEYTLPYEVSTFLCDYLLPEMNRRWEIEAYEKEIAGYVAETKIQDIRSIFK
jgi:hypothetical protein